MAGFLPIRVALIIPARDLVLSDTMKEIMRVRSARNPSSQWREHGLAESQVADVGSLGNK